LKQGDNDHTPTLYGNFSCCAASGQIFLAVSNTSVGGKVYVCLTWKNHLTTKRKKLDNQTSRDILAHWKIFPTIVGK